MYAKVLSVANNKGGIGKSTSVYNIGSSLARSGKTVLLIDMDPQYSLTLACGMEPDMEEIHGMSTMRLFQNNIDPLDCCFSVDSVSAEKPTLFIVPSRQELALTAKRIATQKSALEIFKTNINRLKDYFDYIILDNAPTLDDLLVASLVASDGVIVPVKPEKLSFASLELILPTIEAIKTAPDNQPHNKNLEVIGLIATMFRKQSKEHREYVKKMEDEHKLLGIVPLSTSVTKSIESGLPVVVAYPTSAAAKEYNHIALSI